MTTNPLLWLRTVCSKAGLQIGDQQLDSLGKYVSFLLEWNEKINLISRKDVDNIWKHHILHCLSPLFKVRLPPGIRMLDLGTGGGLPGIPLKILCPSVSLLMIDSTQKKIAAVENMVGRLGLADCRARWGRAEELSRETELRNQFDVVVARGVGPLPELVRLARPFLRGASRPREKGTLECPSLLAYKGGELDGEIARALHNKDVRNIESIMLSAEGLDPAEKKKLVIVQFS